MCVCVRWHLLPIIIIKKLFLLVDSFLLTEMLREKIFQKMQHFICVSNQRDCDFKSI